MCYRKVRHSRSEIFGAACRLGKYTRQHLLDKERAMRTWQWMKMKKIHTNNQKDHEKWDVTNR